MKISRICRRLLSVIMLIAVLFTGDMFTDEIKTVYADTDSEGGEDISGEDTSNEGASNEDIPEEDTADKGTTDGDITPDLDETWNESDNPGMNEDGTIYTVDLTNWVIKDRNDMTRVEYMDDGSAVITWSEEAYDYASVSFKFEGMDFTGWTCVVDAEGDTGTFGFYDAARKDMQYGNPLAASVNYYQTYPFRIELDETVLSSVPDKDNKRADYRNIGSVNFAKGIEKVHKQVIVHSVKFYKDKYDAPVFIVDPESKPQGGSDNNTPGMNEEGTIYTVDLQRVSRTLIYGPTVRYRADGSAVITWHEDSGSYSNVEFSFKRIDVAGWTCVVDATGDCNIFLIADAHKIDPSGYSNLNALQHFGQYYPAAIKCDDWEVGDRVDEYGDPANFNEIGKVKFLKGEETREMGMVINSIKFYKNSEDVPKFIKAKMERPLETPKPTSTPTPTPIPTKTPRPTGAPTSTPAWQATKEPDISPKPSTAVLPNMNPTQAPTQAPMEDTQTSEDIYRRSLRVKGFRVSSKDNRSILIKWKRNSGAASYRIYRSVKKDGAYKLIKTVGGRKTSYTDKKAGYPKKYYYKIAAAGTYKGSNIQGPDSNIRSIFLSGIITPSISVQKGNIGSVNYVTVNLKKYEGDYIDIYTALNRRKFKKLKLVSRSIARYKGKFKIQYIVKNKIIRIKVKTFKRIGKKNRYSMYSNTVSIKV